jgi:protein-disulfide isomerase
LREFVRVGRLRRYASKEDFVIRRLSLAGIFTALVVAGLVCAPSLRRNVSAALLPAAMPQAMQGATDIDPHQAEGSKNAPVIMEVFSDYQCPSCKTLFLSTNRLIVDNYVNTGKVYLIHRDFPLPMHAYSKVAARYARGAAQIGKLAPVQQALFQNQEKWEISGDVDGTVAAALTPAEMVKVRALVKGGTLDAMIEKDYALGMIYHVNSTPTTVLHSKDQTYPVVGIVSFDILHNFIDQLLGQK